MYIASDLHLGKVQDTIDVGGIPSRVVDCISRLREMIEVAAKTAEDVVLAGDIFDTSSPAPWLIELFIRAMKYADEKGVRVHILLGNHDCSVLHHSLEYVTAFPKTTKLYTKPSGMEIEGISVALMPHMPRAYLEKIDYDKALMKVNESPEVVIGHAHLSGAVNTSEVELEAGDALHFDPSVYYKVKLGVFGHIHRHQVLKDKYIYCGPVVTNSFDEANLVKGFVRVHRVKKTGALEWDFLPFSVPETQYKHVTIDLVSKATVNLDPVKIKALASKKLLKITVYAKDLMQVNEAEIRAAFNKFGNVVRFDKILCKEIGEVDEDTIDDVFESINYNPVFASWLKSRDDLTREEREQALAAGTEIIEEVTNAHRVEA